MNIRTLKMQARTALQKASYSPGKLFFLYGAVSLGLGLVIALLDAVLANSIAGTGGLAGMQTRAVLTTAQSVLQLASGIILPFWQFGLVYGSLQLIRQERADGHVLTEGFRRFGPILRLLLMKAVFFMAAIMACSYVSSFLFVLTPLSRSFTELMTPIVESGDVAAMEAMLSDEAAIMELLPTMGGFFVIFLIHVCVICIPLGYRMSMADFVVMDEGRRGGFGAIRESFRLTRRHCMQLFRLDLSFWWFYGISFFVGVLAGLDGLLTMAGVSLPVSAQAAYWICYGAYIVAQLALLTLAAPKVQTTYAAAYETLKAEQQKNSHC